MMGPISGAVFAVQEVLPCTAPLSSDFCLIVNYSKAKVSSYTFFCIKTAQIFLKGERILIGIYGCKINR